MRREAILQTIDSLSRQLARLERFGDDEYERGTVLVFDKTFGGDPEDFIRDCRGKTFTYAAIKAKDDCWYTTGSGRYPN